MKRAWAALLLLSGCSAPDAPQPVREVSESEALAANLSKSFDEVLAASWLVFKFEGSVTDGRGTRTAARGVTRWYRGGVLFVEFESGLCVLRAGRLAWNFDSQVRSWTPYAGKDRPGTGFQSPMDVIAALQSERGSFKPAPRECDLAPWFDYELVPAPPSVAEVFHALKPDLSLDAKTTRMKAEVLDEYRGIGAVEFSGTVVGTREEKGESFQVHARLVRRFVDERPPMKFEAVTVPFTAEMQFAIQVAQGGAK
jgi:hypothetical protein